LNANVGSTSRVFICNVPGTHAQERLVAEFEAELVRVTTGDEWTLEKGATDTYAVCRYPFFFLLVFLYVSICKPLRLMFGV
jgi:hypothetical protein